MYVRTYHDTIAAITVVILVQSGTMEVAGKEFRFRVYSRFKHYFIRYFKGQHIELVFFLFSRTMNCGG